MSTADIRMRPKCSRILMVAFLMAHGVTLTVVWFLPFSWLIKVLIAVAIAFYGVQSYRQHVLLVGDSITEVLARADGRWEVATRHHGCCPGELAHDSLVLPWLTVLNFKLSDGRRRSVTIMPDNVETESFRRLRVRLRFLAKGQGIFSNV